MSLLKRPIAIVSVSLAAAFVFILLWYATFRILSSSNAVISYQIAEAPTESARSDSIRIGSFNIAHGRGGKLGAENWQSGTEADLQRHLDDLASLIQAENLDIVVLNEVDFSSKWSFNINQAAQIAESAGYSHVVEQRNMDVDFPFYEFKFGNAILSRFPVIESEFIEFEPLSAWEDLVAGNHDGVISTIDTPLGKLGLIAVHLEYRDEGIRVLAAKEIQRLARNFEYPIIAAGDFNSTPNDYPGSKTSSTGENAIDYLINKAAFEPPINISSSYLTFPSEAPKLVIDWILEHGELELSQSNVVQSGLSDHLLVTAELKPSQQN